MTDAANVIHEDNLARRNRAAILLKQYPLLSESDLAELSEFYRTAAAIDTALISCDTDLAAKADQFTRDNRKNISRGFEARWVYILYVLGVVVILGAIIIRS